jgi:hypothetical protein
MRGGAILNGEHRVPLYRGIEIGDASVLLNLNCERFNKLIAV